MWTNEPPDIFHAEYYEPLVRLRKPYCLCLTVILIATLYFEPAIQLTAGQAECRK